MKTNDEQWELYNKECIKHFTEKNFGLYRNTLFQMSELLRKEKKYKEQLILLLKVVYCDVSGNSNDGSIDPKETLILAPGILKRIKKVKEFYTDEVLKQVLKLRLPFTYCDDETFKNIVNDILNDVEIDLILKKI